MCRHCEWLRDYKGNNLLAACIEMCAVCIRPATHKYRVTEKDGRDLKPL